MPVVMLKMGSSLNPEDIKEGDDVYFECNIRSNPKAYKLSWFHNVSIRKIIILALIYCFQTSNKCFFFHKIINILFFLGHISIVFLIKNGI